MEGFNIEGPHEHIAEEDGKEAEAANGKGEVRYMQEEG